MMQTAHLRKRDDLACRGKLYGARLHRSVENSRSRPWALPLQDTHLMSQRDELEFQGGAATKPEAEYGNDGGKNRDHARDGRAVAQKSPAFLGPSEF